MLWSSKNWKKWLPATLKITSHPSGSPKLRLASKSPIPFGKLFALPSRARRNGSHGEDSPPGLFPHRRCVALVKMCVFCLGRDSPPKITVFFWGGEVREPLGSVGQLGYPDRLSPGTQGQKAFTLQNCGEPCGCPGALAKPTERDTIFGQNFAACRAWKIKSAVAWLKLSPCNLQRTNSKIFQVHKLSKSHSSMIQWIHNPTVVNHIFYEKKHVAKKNMSPIHFHPVYRFSEKWQTYCLSFRCQTFSVGFSTVFSLRSLRFLGKDHPCGYGFCLETPSRSD